MPTSAESELDVGRSLTEARWACLASLAATSIHRRLQVAVPLLYATGLHLSEVAAASADDLEWVSLTHPGTGEREEGWRVTVIGKGTSYAACRYPGAQWSAGALSVAMNQLLLSFGTEQRRQLLGSLCSRTEYYTSCSEFLHATRTENRNTTGDAVAGAREGHRDFQCARDKCIALSGIARSNQFCAAGRQGGLQKDLSIAG